MLAREDVDRVGSGSTELTVLLYDGKRCRYFRHGGNNDETNPGNASPDNGDDGRSVAESELSAIPWVWPNLSEDGDDACSVTSDLSVLSWVWPDLYELQPSAGTSVVVATRSRTPGAVVKLEEYIAIKLEEPDARPYAFSVARSRSSTPQPAAYSGAPQPDPTTGLLPPGWIMCRWDTCREIVREDSLKPHVLYSRAHANGNKIMRHSDGVKNATHCLWDHCGHNRGKLFAHVRMTHFGDHVCDCCRNRFGKESHLNSHLKKLCAKRCGHCLAVFATRDDARVHYETRVCVPVAPQDASLVAGSTSTGPSLFRCLWAGCNVEVGSDDDSIKRHLRFAHKLLTVSTPFNEECLCAGCTREVKQMRAHVMSQHVKK